MSADPTLSTDERIHLLEQKIVETQQRFTDSQTALRLQSEQIAEVLKQNKEIRELLSRLTSSNAQAGPTGKTDSPPLSEQLASFVSRRSMLKKAAMATLGAAAVLETMPSARAADGGDFILGESNSTNSSTYLSSGVVGPALSVTNFGSGSAIAGVSSSASDGIYGESVNGHGVVGQSTSNSGVYGKSGTGAGVAGDSGINSGVCGVSSSGYGVYGQGYYGAGLKGTAAPLYLNASMLSTPYADTNIHFSGELFVDHNGGLWYCTGEGTPGRWRKLADSGTAGSYAAFPEPTRFIDTRTSSESLSSTGASAPPPGASTATPYILSGANVPTPYVPPGGGTPPSIPYGATAVVGRITVLNGMNGHSTTKGGLKLSSVNPPAFGSGLISWGSTASVQATTFVLPLDNTTTSGSGQIYALNSSAKDDIDILVDLSGYYY